jgi:LPXTG-motif cell wall-anchored protein
MKRVVLAMATMTMLVTLRVAAQTYPEPTTSNTEPKVTTQGTTEERTNPTSATHSEDPGLTATGTVVSWNDDEVVINTATGPTHVKLLPSTLGARTFTEGESIAIDFSRNEQGVLLAKQIRASETVTGSEVANTSAVAEVKEEVDEAAMSTKNALNPPVATPPAPETTTVSTPANLPATASNSPLLALLGLVALGGAVALRRR